VRIPRPTEIPPALRGALWGMRARRRVNRALGQGRGGQIDVPDSGRIGPAGLKGVRVVLRVFKDRCLVDALVRQQWYAAHGSRRALMIGVQPPAAGFAAHAWLEGDPPWMSAGFTELARRDLVDD
jgi:hypothetical protein